MLDSADPLRRNAAVIVQRLRTCVNGRYAGHAVPPTKRFARGRRRRGHSLTELSFSIYLGMFRGEGPCDPPPPPYPHYMNTKRCTKCGEEKPATREFFGSTRAGNLRGTCRTCMNARSKQYAKDNPESVRRRARERQARANKWKPSDKLKHELFLEQNGLCGLCGEPMPCTGGATPEFCRSSYASRPRRNQRSRELDRINQAGKTSSPGALVPSNETRT